MRAAALVLVLMLLAAGPATAQSRGFDKTGILRCTTTDSWVVQASGGRDSARAIQSRNLVPIHYAFDLKRETISINQSSWPIRLLNETPLEVVVSTDKGEMIFSITETGFTETIIVGGNVEVSFGTCVREQ
ncbi:MAG: hypothetical protein ACAH11_04725 [Sphingomonas sp.]